MNQWDGNTTRPTDEETNKQVRDWLGNKKWLGQVHSTNQRGFGHITVYNGAQVLLDPNDRQVNAWFWNSDLELDEGDWVVFVPEDSQSKEKRKYNNPYLMQAVAGSVELVEEISQLRDSLQELESPFMSLQDDYLECLFVFGERLFIAKAYADELEAEIKEHYQHKFETFRRQERARLGKWQNEEQARLEKWQREGQARLDEDRGALAEERRTFEEESQRTRQDIAKELEVLDQLDEEYQRAKQDMTEKREKLEQLEEKSRRTKQDMAKKLEVLDQLEEEYRRTKQDMDQEVEELNNLKEERKDVKQHLAQEWMELEEVEAKRQQMTQDMSKTRDELEKLETKRQRIEQDIAKKVKELEQFEEESRRTEQEMALEAEELNNLKEERKDLKRHLAQEWMELEQVETKRNKITQEITLLGDKLEKLKTKRQRIEQDIAKKVKELEQFEEESRRTEQEMAQEVEKLNNLKEERKDLKRHLAQEWMELEKVETKRQHMTQGITLLGDQLEKLETKRQHMTQEITLLGDELEKLETKREHIEQDIAKKVKEVEQFEEESRRTKEDMAQEVEKLNNLKKEHKDVKQDLAEERMELQKVKQHLPEERMELEKVETKRQDMTQKISLLGNEVKKLDAKRLRIEQDIAKEREKIKQERAEIGKKLEELKRQSAAMERKRRDIENEQKIIRLSQKLVNESLQRWGFDPINVAKSTDELRFNKFDNERELIERVENYIAAQGYHFKRDDIVNFYTCLKTGAIVVLAGLSGTGKSSLIRLFAEAVGAKERFRLVSVKATWNDDSDLRGFYHPEKKSYISTPFLDIIVRANAHPEQLFFVCLDEMNLSRVEYYFSDFLSVLEQDKKERKLPLYSENEWRIRKSQLERQRQALENGKLTQEEFDHLARNVHCYGHEVLIPDNLFICGTVNVDETTYPFSDKVLDRVQIIQFESVEFLDDEITKDLSIRPVNLSFNQFQEYCRQASEIPIDNNWFNELNRCLQTGGFHFGYRVKRQIQHYCAYALHSGLFDNLSPDEIVDMQIVQKILPKIRGIKSKPVVQMFDKLRGFCHKYPQASTKISILEQMDSINYWEVFRYVR